MPFSGPSIFFEASVLGQARATTLARTGIHRCIFELLSELYRNHPDMTLIPYSRNADAAEDLLFVLQQHPLPHGLASRQVWLARFLNGVLPPALAKGKVRRLVHKIRSSAYETAFLRALAATHGTPLIQDTFLGTMQRSRSQPSHRLVFAYDLIPILFPANAPAGFFSQFDAFYASLQPSDTVISISESTRRDLLRCYTQLDPHRCLVIPLAASDHFRPQRDQRTIAAVKTSIGLAVDQPYLLSVCTLEPRKNLVAVVKAFARLSGLDSIHASLRLVLVGASGWGDQAELTALAKELGVFDRLLITGYLPEAALPALYSSAIGFLYPSLYEGFGLPVLEAMQCGTPVITSNRSSLPEVVGEAGFMVDPTDTAELTRAMQALLESSDLQRRLSAQSLERASFFSWRSTASQLADVYRTLHQSSVPATRP